MLVRAVTLFEMLVVVAILGIFAALAAPNLLPLVQKGRLRGATEEVAAFLDDARHRAATQGRCFRVRITGSDTLLMERRNSADCVNLAADGWETAERKRVIAGFTLTSLAAPSITNADERLIFRPNSRLRGDGTLTNTAYGTRVVVAPVGGGVDNGLVFVTRNGRICTQTTQTVPLLTVPVVCP